MVHLIRSLLTNLYSMIAIEAKYAELRVGLIYIADIYH